MKKLKQPTAFEEVGTIATYGIPKMLILAEENTNLKRLNAQLKTNIDTLTATHESYSSTRKIEITTPIKSIYLGDIAMLFETIREAEIACNKIRDNYLMSTNKTINRNDVQDDYGVFSSYLTLIKNRLYNLSIVNDGN